MPTVVIYDRLSRLFADEAPDHRIAACKAYAEQRGWNVVHIATDANISGASKLEDRPGMREVLSWLPRCDYVLAAKLDRFARSSLEFYRLLDAAKTMRAAIVTADNLVSPENAGLIIGVLAAFAEHERKMITDRITASKEHFRSKGNHLGGIAPYGYAVTGPVNNKRWVIDEPAAAILRECADRLMNHGGSLTGLAEELNTRGVLPPAEHARQRDGRKLRGQRWHSTTLRDVLYTPTVRGWAVQATPGTRRSALTNKAVLDAENNPVSAGPAILDAETWQTVRSIIDGKSVGRGAERSGKALLLHVARCSLCDGPMYRQRRAVDGKDYSTYVCRAGVGKRGAHAPNVIIARLLEEHVTADFLKRFGTFSFARWVEPDGSAVLQLADVTAQLDNLSASIPHLPAGGRTWRLAMAQVDALERREAELRTEAEHAVGRWEDTGVTVADEWEQRDESGRRTLLADLGARVIIAPLAPGKARRFDPERLALAFAGPAWVRDADPAEAALQAVALEDLLDA
ncbi:recombinase family protein [Streptomyces sp. NBC_01571]|uniref:recombinase family protein n=1 Tax=Streptomyces sp. NBC_01571 TaxID=2975883 RepID=UPI00225C1104|nr:recombinase family protein [Streptomyces sp. NBC_01571]MCX4576577.1 recombinase family protein [Streptomyces sp. NBC_01571]